MGAEKPAIAKVLESCKCITRLIANTECGMKLGEKAYMENNDRAFGKAPGDDTKDLFDAERLECAGVIEKNFAGHPQLAKAIAGISGTFLRADAMPEHRSLLKSLLHREDGPEKYVCIWGTQDIVVPHKYAHEVVAMNPEKVKLIEPCLGHECIHEDAKQVGQIVVDELFKGTE